MSNPSPTLYWIQYNLPWVQQHGKKMYYKAQQFILSLLDWKGQHENEIWATAVLGVIYVFIVTSSV